MRNLINETDAKIKDSTKIYEGRSFNDMVKAKEFAKEKNSYVFDVFQSVKNEKGRHKKVLYGYGIPK